MGLDQTFSLLIVNILTVNYSVNHPCPYEKWNSGYRIIEIDVDSELTTIHPFDEQNRHMHFFNFKFERKIRPTTKVERFSLLSDDKGKHLKLDEIDCCQFDEHLPNAVYDIISQEPNDNNSLISGLAHARRQALSAESAVCERSATVTGVGANEVSVGLGRDVSPRGAG